MKPALLIIDMQNRWINSEKRLFPGSSTVISNINKLRSLFRDKKLEIYHITLTHKSDGSTLSRFDKTLWNVDGSQEAKIITDLTPSQEEHVMTKHRYSAFSGTCLRKELNDNNIDTCLITGYQLRACVLATALDAYQMDFDPWVISDACIDTDENYLEFFINYFKDAEASKTTDEVISMFL